MGSNCRSRVVQARRDESISVIQLYKALGGGWLPDPPAKAAAQQHEVQAAAIAAR